MLGFGIRVSIKFGSSQAKDPNRYSTNKRETPIINHYKTKDKMKYPKLKSLNRAGLLLGCFAFAASALFGQVDIKTNESLLTGSAPTIDGEADAMWDAVPWTEIGYLMPDPWVTPDTAFEAKYKLLHTETHLYILVEVVDDVLAVYTEGAGAWQDDSIELFFDLANDGGAYDSFTSQTYFRAVDDGEFYAGGGTEITDIDRDTMELDTGYRVEIAIAWGNWGLSATELTAIGFDINVNDGDVRNDWAPARLLWNNTENDSSQSAEFFGVVNLVDEVAPSKLEADAVRVDDAPTIDGEIDGAWDMASWNQIAYLMPDPWVTPDTPFEAMYKLLWDDTNLYILVEVVDDVLAVYTEGVGAWQDDSIELFFDLANDGGAYDSFTSQTYFRAVDDEAFYAGGGTEITTIDRNTVETDTGYRVEISVAWSNWGVTAGDLSAIGFDINVNDGDVRNDWAPARLLWNNTANDSSQSAEGFGIVNLVEDTGGSMYGGYPLQDGWIETDEAGWLYVGGNSWLYSLSMEGWMYASSESFGSSGTWFYIAK